MTVATVPKIEFVFSPFPEPGEPVWDEICLEWLLIDVDGFRYYGETPSACARQYQEAMHYLAANGQPNYHAMTQNAAEQEGYEGSPMPTWPRRWLP